MTPLADNKTILRKKNNV